MKKVYKCNLFNEKSLHQLINDLNYYTNNYLETVCMNITHELSKLGMMTANQCKSMNEFGEYIHVSTFDYFVKNGYGTILIATQMGTIKAEWTGSDGQARAEVVDPLLMAEYGSGLKAGPAQSIIDGHQAVGQGTFPNQTHATDPKGWWWKDDKTEEWHHSTGIEPTMPMYFAMFDMFNEAEKIVRKAFRS